MVVWLWPLPSSSTFLSSHYCRLFLLSFTNDDIHWSDLQPPHNLERHIKLNFIPFKTRIIGLLILGQISNLTSTCDVKTWDDQLQLVCTMKWINQFKTSQKNVLIVAMKVITEKIVHLDTRIILYNVVLIKYLISSSFNDFYSIFSFIF